MMKGLIVLHVLWHVIHLFLCGFNCVYFVSFVGLAVYAGHNIVLTDNKVFCTKVVPAKHLDWTRGIP